MIKITVLRREFYPDLVEEYRSGGNTICELFVDGQEFFSDDYGPPKDFPCPWAWDDIYKYFLVLRQGGDFDHDMKVEKAVVACCTDGVRPVIFKLERIDD